MERPRPRHPLAVGSRADRERQGPARNFVALGGIVRLRILLTGRQGQVGWELERALPALGEVIATDQRTLDLGDPDAIRLVARETKPQLIVNAAAYTAVDRAESELKLAMRVNGVAPGVLAEEAKRVGALLVHYSTDYVFDGEKPSPYVETDATNPLTSMAAASSPESRRYSARDAGTSSCARAGCTRAREGTSCSRCCATQGRKKSCASWTTSSARRLRAG